MVEELTIIMEPLIEEIVVTVTREAESLNPLIVQSDITFDELKRKVLFVSKLQDVHMLYVDDEGDAINLDSKDEFIKAWKQALVTKQLHIMAQPPLKVTPSTECPRPNRTTPFTGHSPNPYIQLAAGIGKDRKQKCEKVGQSLLDKTVPSESEPLWFSIAMKKYTDKVIRAMTDGINNTSMTDDTPSCTLPVRHNNIVCDGCERGIQGVRYKCGNCADYDLCEQCEQLSSFLHTDDHVFLKIKKVAEFAGVNKRGKRKPLLKRSVYLIPTMVTVPTVNVDMLKAQESVIIDKDDVIDQTVPPMIRKSKDKLRQELKGIKHYKKHHHSKHQTTATTTTTTTNGTTECDVIDGWEQSDDMIKKTKKQLKRDLHEAKLRKKMEKREIENMSSTKGHGKCLSSRFVEDTSYPDDTVVYYGKPFTKGWIIENTGTKTWKKVKLVYQNGFHPIELEIIVPELEPGDQTEIMACYPSATTSDGIEIKSSWRLIHDGHTPFGDTLWLSVIAQPDPTDELSGTFEHVTYPILSDDESLGFAAHQTSLCSNEYTMVDTPLLSLASNDSLFEYTNKDDGSNDDGSITNDNDGSSITNDNDDGSSITNDDEDFVVIIPDCFKLDIPLSGFDLPEQILSPVDNEETPTFNEDTTPTFNDEATPTCTTNNETVLNNESPTTIRKRLGTFGRDTLDAAWTSRSRNPLRYAVGVVNTVTDLVDQHVHFSTQKSDDNEEETMPTTDETTPTNDEIMPTVNEATATTVEITPTTNETTPTAYETTPSKPKAAYPIPTLLNVSDITVQDSDISRYVNQKWEGHKQPETPMDNLISMGFANRDLNSRLLTKHKNNLQQTLQELLETNGDGYQDDV